MRYFDHGATSYPKPQVVVDAVVRALTELGGNPGRGAYRLAVETGRAIYEARRSCAHLLGVADTRDLLFLSGCTEGCNLMLRGLLGAGDTVVVGAVEHNAVVRPLALLERVGVRVVRARADADGTVTPDAVAEALAAGPVRAVVVQHASNVSGTVQPIADIARVAHDAGAVMLVDGAQAAGHVEVDVAGLGVDAYAVSGHKGMLGPQGVGMLYLRPGLEVEEIQAGGTGSHSESPEMPRERPDRYEAGTPNTPGILGLGAAARFLAENGPAQRARERELVNVLHEGVLGIGGYTVLGPGPGVERVPVLSVVPDRLTPGELAARLDREYDIACRAGLHCAPWAHESFGTLSTGSCRFGIGYGTDRDAVDELLSALRELAS